MKQTHGGQLTPPPRNYILQIRWPNTISNSDLWEKTHKQNAGDEIRRRWGWVGHTLRKPALTITRQALTWNPQGKRKIGRPRNTWRRDLLTDIKRTGYSWGSLKRKLRTEDFGRLLSMTYVPGGAKTEEEEEYYINYIIQLSLSSKVS